ncbi:MAG: clan AA aspartic protease [Candidatus Coatesbacteria bacterium]|nr:clan AA aspartic protease [Candidatus Coatesbacteria bacterium]
MKELLKKGYIPIQLKKNRLGHFLIPVKIKNRRFDFILDTGATATCLDRDLIYILDFKKSSKKDPQAQGLGGSVAAEIINLSLVSIGEIDISSINVALIDLTSVKQACELKKAKTIQGIIGVDLLERCKAVIDWANKTIWLKQTT